MRIEEEKLIRKPFSSFIKHHHCVKPRYVDSPDKTMYVAHSHCHEPHMMVDISLFTLVSNDNKVINNFEPLVSYGCGIRTNWSISARYFCVPIVGKKSLVENYYFIYDTKLDSYTIIPVKSAHESIGNIENKCFVLKKGNHTKLYELHALKWLSYSDFDVWTEIKHNNTFNYDAQ